VILSELARAEARRRHGIGGLQSIVLTPTVACNLRCEHCYNLFEIHEDNRERLPLDLMHRVIGEARALGAYRASFIGGEPLLRASDLAELGRAYPDVLMTVFTNGLLLTGAMADELAALGNVELSFSIDGFEVDHDRWRGPGTRRKTLESMARYHQAGGMALFSPTVTSENHRDLLSDRFLDEMAAHGAYMGYLHHYDLVGGQRRADWLLDRGQLAWMKARIEEIHRTRDLALLSNVVSDLVAGGCPAARDFVHINHKGEVEPCCMVPFAADNVKDRPLLDALRSPFFARISAIEPDAVGIKRCLVGENIGEMGAAVRAGEARGTTLVASQSLPSARRSLPLAPRAAEDLPTCFSQPAAP
jgi:MoaA/NifB/PqqE/SkfB family radical SAM enzyme